MQDEEFTLSMIYAMIFWWLKPIYEKPLLTWLSQALFANEMTVASTIKQGWKTIFSHWVKLLFSRRLSLSRQLLIPILLLENPTTYKQLNQRHRLLQRGQGSGVTWHTLLMVHVEFIVSMGVVLFIYALIPKEIMSSNLLVKFLEHTPVILVFSWAILYFLTLSIVAPFFICGGFAVYLTKRCLLEGWDIELIFKQLNGRFMAVQNDPFAREQRP
ncbi:MAG: hypothetical protein KGV51_08785, partial [Moraxellaceae bacterium]|nr:hypothetical protein [Moraxellaceae bacterium]